MTASPKVSVVIPAYRCADTVTEAIDSALAQDVPLEIILVDDCPDAPVSAVIQRYLKDGRLRYIQNKHNLGAAESRNIGVSMAQAPYVAFLDADDRWCPGKLKKQLAAMEQHQTVLCCTGRQLLSPDGTPSGRWIGVKESISYRELLKHNSIGCSSVVISADVAREFPMEHADSHEDYILWLKILQKYGFACGINEPLLQYRLSNTGKSGSKLHSAKMTFRVYRYMGFGMIKSLLCFCSYALHGVGKYLFTKKETKESP